MLTEMRNEISDWSNPPIAELVHSFRSRLCIAPGMDQLPPEVIVDIAHLPDSNLYVLYRYERAESLNCIVALTEQAAGGVHTLDGIEHNDEKMASKVRKIIQEMLSILLAYSFRIKQWAWVLKNVIHVAQYSDKVTNIDLQYKINLFVYHKITYSNLLPKFSQNPFYSIKKHHNMTRTKVIISTPINKRITPLDFLLFNLSLQRKTTPVLKTNTVLSSSVPFLILPRLSVTLHHSTVPYIWSSPTLRSTGWNI